MPTRITEWQRKHSRMYGPRVTIASGIPAAVKKYADDHNMTETGVFVAAVKEKLQREGYWKPVQSQPYSDLHDKIVVQED